LRIGHCRHQLVVDIDQPSQKQTNYKPLQKFSTRFIMTQTGQSTLQTVKLRPYSICHTYPLWTKHCELVGFDTVYCLKPRWVSPIMNTSRFSIQKFLHNPVVNIALSVSLHIKH